MASDHSNPASPATGPRAIIADQDALASHRYTPCGDGRLAWRMWGAGPPLVLLHGGAGSWTHWIRNIPSLASSYTVLAPDLPGLGDSDALPAAESAETLAGVISRGLDTLIPDKPFHLAGFSFGGVLAGHVATQQAGRTRTLLMVGAGGLGIPQGNIPSPQRWSHDMSSEEVAAVHRHNLGLLMFGDPAKIDSLAVHIQTENTRRARFRERAIAQSDTLRRILPKVQARLFVLYGSLDVYATPLLAERRALFRKLQPGASFSIIDGVGHWVPYEAAQRFNDLLLAAVTAP